MKYYYIYATPNIWLIIYDLIAFLLLPIIHPCAYTFMMISFFDETHFRLKQSLRLKVVAYSVIDPILIRFKTKDIHIF